MGKKILLADDSITIQKVIELTFSDEDFEVVTVGNGRLAIERIQEVRPDVILCDIIMPEKDGYEVCDFVKNNPSLSHTPVLLLAGAFEPFDQERAARVKSDGFLAKPFEPQTLIARVKELMGSAAPPVDAAIPQPTATPAFTATPSPVPLTPAPVAEAATYSEEYNFIPEEPFPAAEAALVAEEEAEPAATLEEEFYSVVEPSREPPSSAPELEMVTEYEGADSLLPAEASRAPEESATRTQAPPTPLPISGELELTPEPSPKPAMPAWTEPTEEMTWEARAQASAGTESRAESASALFEEVFDEELASAAEAPPEEASHPAVMSPPTRVTPLPSPAHSESPEEIKAAPVESFADVVSAEERVAPPSTASQMAVPREMVSQIAQRVISQVSEKIVREIAWEVVPELAETLIKKEIERLKSELKET
ncbi:MAG: response regulator [Vicinamibacteria bacterium]|nr:response regulator [Vicinamibacteria bacterium]